jgi:NADPH:quinone reductase-like Zn-dependent oxidoreductase
MADNREDLETMMQLMRLGKVRAVVDSCFPLRRASDTWDRSIGRHSSGKIIVCPDGSP